MRPSEWRNLKPSAGVWRRYESGRGHYHLLNEKFHAAIYAGSHDAYLVEATRATRRRFPLFRWARFLTVGRLAKSYKEHDAILIAILQGNRDLAAESMRRHILTVDDSHEEYASLKCGGLT